ncbi:hydroxyphenylacetyl-CoA thioesterase PaaI [Amycolatopsis sp. PS_44_ISF1]|uniref:hydroxyphenylacetyl-CoA thioesterase PaaI n=1 Tax=Amycolatopsis sp. PS_44_ISF1 TaxID=2974917 RepID=UPI0028DF7DAF|nr:hydroxyphenylacetyl-CoA thioesterase PaaI [Amycolatopsis sp. PS_44_ISF1]MDT8916143.1 hydroxyphenylacetyl-CoA thioesterase PaaI [Amycolatopsis sp. PS_44_ISF1]
MFALDRASHALGIELVEAADGNAVATMVVTASMVNGHDIAHGGYLFLLADTAFALACNSHGPVTVAAGAEVSFVASGRLGDRLVATAAERTTWGRGTGVGHRGRNGIYDVTVHRETPEGPEVVAEFRGRSRVVRTTGEA